MLAAGAATGHAGGLGAVVVDRRQVVAAVVVAALAERRALGGVGVVLGLAVGAGDDRGLELVDLAAVLPRAGDVLAVQVVGLGQRDVALVGARRGRAKGGCGAWRCLRCFAR